MNVRLLYIALFCSGTALAASPVQDNANLENSVQNYKGNLSINQAAGDQQQQTNTRAIAIGHEAQASTHVIQRIDAPYSRALDANASISGSSFSNGSGVLGINQSAGAGTQQANAVRIGISAVPQSIDDSTLLQQNVALSNSSDPTGQPSGSRQVSTSDQAFGNSRGVVQLNQSAGVGNRMANTLSVRVAD